MIRMNKYDRVVEKNFFKIVEDVVDIDDRVAIVRSFRQYFPTGIIPNGIDELEAFERLVLADYKTIEALYCGICQPNMKNEVFVSRKSFTDLYKSYHSCYEKIIQKKIGNEKLNVYLVRSNKTYTCPYCNRNYITVRGKKWQEHSWTILSVEENIPYLR